MTDEKIMDNSEYKNCPKPEVSCIFVLIFLPNLLKSSRKEKEGKSEWGGHKYYKSIES